MISRGVIFKQALYDTRRSILWWGLGIGVLAFYICLAYPLIEGLEEMQTLMESPIFQALIGEIGEMDYTSPQGFLGIEFFSWIPLIIAVYAVLFNINITSGEEARGTLDILLSTPTPRWQIIVEKYLAYIVATTLILAISMLGLLAGVYFVPDLQPVSGEILQGMINVLPPLLFIGAVTLLLSTLFSTPTQAGGVAAGIVVASYFLNSLAGMANSAIMDALQTLSFYKYYAPFNVLTDGINWGYFVLIVAVSLALFALSIVTFERRDITV